MHQETLSKHARESSDPQDYPKPNTGHLNPPKDDQNLQNPSKIEDFTKYSWKMNILDLPPRRTLTLQSGDSCGTACDTSQYAGSWIRAQMAEFGSFWHCLTPETPLATHVPTRAARSDQPKSLLYVYITRVFNAGTGLGCDKVAILHETALAVVTEIEPGHPRILLRLQAPAI